MRFKDRNACNLLLDILVGISGCIKVRIYKFIYIYIYTYNYTNDIDIP